MSAKSHTVKLNMGISDSTVATDHTNESSSSPRLTLAEACSGSCATALKSCKELRTNDPDATTAVEVINTSFAKDLRLIVHPPGSWLLTTSRDGAFVQTCMACERQVNPELRVEAKLVSCMYGLAPI